MKLRNAFKTAASNLDSRTFQLPSNIRAKVRQMETLRPKVYEEWAPGYTVLTHWPTMSSSAHVCTCVIQL